MDMDMDRRAFITPAWSIIPDRQTLVLSQIRRASAPEPNRTDGCACTFACTTVRANGRQRRHVDLAGREKQ